MTEPAPRRIPTYTPHLRIQVNGQLGNQGSTYEIFSYGLSVSGANSVTTDPQDLNDMVDDVLAFHGRNASGISAYARITNVKVAYVMADGKWDGGQPLIDRTENVPGGVPTNANPGAPQVALAVTLRTASNTPRTRGRFYLPLPTHTVDHSAGVISQAAAQAVADSVTTLVNDLNNGPGVGDADGVVVASTFGALTPVTQVSVGRVYDVITTRRNKIRELYVPGGAIT